MRILLVSEKETLDISSLVATAKWQGDKRQAVRTLQLSVAASPSDKGIPTVDLAVGGTIKLEVGGDELFHGKIVARTKQVDSSTIDLTCQDNGRHLVRNHFKKKYTNQTPEQVAAQLVGEINKMQVDPQAVIEIGYLEPTGVAISRLFLSGRDSAYAIIRTLYNIAAKTTGKKYHIGLRGKKLFVVAMDVSPRTLVIQAKSNLISASVSESIEKVVSEVEIYSVDGQLVRTVRQKETAALYDAVRNILTQTKGDDKATEAQKLLDEGGLEQKINVDALGNIACVSGGTVVVQEPYTGLYGLFYIDGDIHEWKRGQHYMRLAVNLKNIMDETEVGTLPNADGSKTKVTSKKKIKPEYHYDKEKEKNYSKPSATPPVNDDSTGRYNPEKEKNY